MGEEPTAGMIDRRRLLRYGIGTLGAAALGPMVLGGCGGSSAPAPSTTAPPPTGGATSGEALLEGARAEGTVIAPAIGEPHSYYTPVIEGFEEFAGFEMDLPHPTFPAPAQVSALRDDIDAGVPPRFDVLEITQSTGDRAAEEGLITPYTPDSWSDIPSVLKDPDGMWAASYFGLLSFIVNTTATGGFVPTSWDELRNGPDTLEGAFAMLGDPRTGQPFEGGLALLTVMSAALANGGSLDDVEPGLGLLGELVEKKIFDLDDALSLVALPDTIATGPTSIRALASFDTPLARWNGEQEDVTVESAAPSDGLIAVFYPQALVTDAQHPQAAKLWIDHLQSDDAAEAFLRNGAIPARHGAIAESGSAELRDLLPPEAERNAPVPLPSQITAAQAVVDEKWTQYIPVEG